MNVYNIIKEKEAFVDRWFDISLDYTVEDIVNTNIQCDVTYKFLLVQSL
jgi:hypothetical protein